MLLSGFYIATRHWNIIKLRSAVLWQIATPFITFPREKREKAKNVEKHYQSTCSRQFLATFSKNWSYKGAPFAISESHFAKWSKLLSLPWKAHHDCSTLLPSVSNPWAHLSWAQTDIQTSGMKGLKWVKKTEFCRSCRMAWQGEKGGS